ncbi:hypothetical protein PENSUB_1580 [Penicillium subrubescens]|uniref:MARVEL domain-containing protein n=1 Tax=Penicillium subrubescens TaxID=1316194 RepID=A0A1Q5UK37_9EURO|nr:hypothetical protein PENSUB_1580 [Penicillium subrubescens]
MSSFHSHPLGIVTLVAHFVQCAVLTPVAFALSTGFSCVSRHHSWHVVPLYLTDTVLSYLWLTSFIFLAQNFNQTNCSFSRWNGEVVCSRQYAAEAFAFIAFGSFVTLGSLLFQFFYAYTYRPQFALPGEEQRAKENLHGNLETAGVL